ncbi:hypothetical protein SAMN05661008_00102 [Alkalithermobacter thermoalcaliphilus JW-YL-7 = DSM 7308]|uniref:Uncharacterized protein n=1 Tax=Alkalithermobacter thermoalcaliphilus JW-YL-7 = DSM 7308 TaxID=1121328 RepID=A0A150FRW2_CLOPD|nr:hypothetical protein JWYL7_1419 [[Clostridium] paradoxum JW-YL-7 = DSM 7308]SHK37027.1 hypothetical protein SAMN05661008_00102 [[Clostridium] paradoxum JW-YL-7 = DSM 7308]
MNSLMLTRKKLLFLFTFILVIISIHKFIFEIKLREIENSKQTLKQYKFEMKNVKETFEKYKNIDKELIKINDVIYEKSEKLLDYIGQEEILLILNEIIEKSKLNTTKIEFLEEENIYISEDESLLNPKTINVNITYSDKYESLLDFIAYVNNYSKSITIENLSIDIDEYENLTGKIILKFYSVSKIHKQKT